MPPQMNYQIRKTDGALKGNLGWLYTILWLHCDQLLRCFPSNDLLMSETGIKSTATLTKHRNQLIKMKAITLVPYEKRFMVIEGELHPRKYIYQITGILELPDGKIIPTVHFSRPETLKAHINVLADLEFDTSLIIQAHASHDENSEFHKLKLLDFSHRSSTLKERALSSTISSAEKSAEVVAPDTASDAKQKRDDAPENHWRRGILAFLTNDWMAADFLEKVLGIPLGTFDQFETSDHPAAVALYMLRMEGEVQDMPGATQNRRQWRLWVDKPKGDDTPEIDWKAKILATLTDEWMHASILEDLLDIPLRIFDPFEFANHPASIALYQFESERKVEYEPSEGGKRRRWRLHQDYGQPAPKSDFDLLKLAIERRLDINNGALLSVTHMLRGTSAKKDAAYYWESKFFQDENACTADDIDNMVDYFVEKCGAIATLPARPEVISNWIMKARKHKAAAGKQPEMNWDVEPEEPETLTIVDWEDES